MYSLFVKEITSFLSSLTGYVVIVVFLLACGLFLWVFKGNLNIPDNGYATLESLFVLAPWVFLFLIPAITMRMFAEEKKSRTLELLLTRPLTDMQVIVAKYMATLVLVILSLIPTLIYFYSVSQLGNPPGNLDTGAAWGSYFGLLFLAGIYIAIGIFISSLTENQIISFIFALITCFIFYIGFDYFASLDIFSGMANTIMKLGINEHYRSVSRGVLDTRDILYYLSIIFIFLLLTKIVLQSRNWQSNS
ncbi:MAG: gliding motility-associated ABC transporter permease subunit GldF [Bacteroides sp. SM23_62_1]|nr:MAG: gliding motility-associated ABC transporter permease subunit GldF [Bacteroides sp. SM23_62_1]